MMKILNYKRFIILCIVIMPCVLYSCKKILNPEVIELPTADNAILNGPDVDKAVAGAYSLLRSVVPDKVFLMGDMRSNAFSSYSDVQNIAVETRIHNNDIGSLLNNDGGNWNGFYRVIAQCNLVLEKIPTITNYDPELKRRHIGEASFVRALSYFYLVRFWGDVPINLKSVNLDNLPRTAQADVFKQINMDLDMAIANLQLSYSPGENAVRATKGAAWAIKAHVAAWLHDYSGCEKLCDNVINQGPYTLVTDTTNLISIFVGKSSEGIFELNFDANLKEVQKNKVFTRTMGKPWYNQADQPILCPKYAELDQMFVPGTRDARRFTWFVRGKYKTPTVTDNRVYFGKYRTLQLNGDTTSQNINESNIIVTRLADIILLRAEALADPSVGRTSEAVVLLNKVRARAFAPLYAGGGSIQDTILFERKKELLGEGQYFFDLVRTRKLAAYSSITAADWYTSGAWLLPIDQTIIAKSNFAITQNSFWR